MDLAKDRLKEAGVYFWSIIEIISLSIDGPGRLDQKSEMYIQEMSREESADRRERKCLNKRITYHTSWRRFYFSN